MKEEPNLYSFMLIAFAFLGFVCVFAYNLYLGNRLDCALLRASLAVFFSFLPLKCFFYYLEKARNASDKIEPRLENRKPEVNK